MIPAQYSSLGNAPISAAKGTFGRLQVEKGGKEGTPAWPAKKLNQPRSGMKMDLTSGISMRHVLLGRSLKHSWAAPLILTGCESAESAKSPTGINGNMASVPRMGNRLSK